MDQDLQVTYTIYHNYDIILCYIVSVISTSICMVYQDQAIVVLLTFNIWYIVRSIVMSILRRKPSVFNIETERLVISILSCICIVLLILNKKEYLVPGLLLIVCILLIKFIPIKVLNTHYSYYQSSNINYVYCRISTDCVQASLLVMILCYMFDTSHGIIIFLTCLIGIIAILTFLFIVDYLSTITAIQLIIHIMVLIYINLDVPMKYNYYIGFLNFFIGIGFLIEIIFVCCVWKKGKTNTEMRVLMG